MGDTVLRESFGEGFKRGTVGAVKRSITNFFGEIFQVSMNSEETLAKYGTFSFGLDTMLSLIWADRDQIELKTWLEAVPVLYHDTVHSALKRLEPQILGMSMRELPGIISLLQQHILEELEKNKNAFCRRRDEAAAE